MKSLQAIRVLSQNVDTYTHMDTQSVLAKQGAVQGTIVAGIAVKLVQKHMECIMLRQG